MFEELAREYVASSYENLVYMNIWNYDSSWKLEVREGENLLEAKRLRVREPLHLVSYTANALMRTGACLLKPRRLRICSKSKLQARLLL